MFKEGKSDESEDTKGLLCKGATSGEEGRKEARYDYVYLIYTLLYLQLSTVVYWKI